MVKTNSVVVNLDNALKAYYPGWDESDSDEWLEKYHLKGNITLHRDTYHDGEVSVRYNTGEAQGLLRFSETGGYHDGIDSRDNANSPFTTFLIALAFGESELTKAFDEEGKILFDSAKAVYACHQKGARLDGACFKNAKRPVEERQKSEEESKKIESDKKTTEAMKFANQILEQAKKEDWGPGGYDATEVQSVIDSAVRQLAVMSNNTAAESEARYQTTSNMLTDVTKTKTGLDSCFDLKICTTIKKADYGCGSRETGERYETYDYLNGNFLQARVVDIVGNII